jgi:hypothetical protein
LRRVGRALWSILAADVRRRGKRLKNRKRLALVVAVALCLVAALPARGDAPGSGARAADTLLPGVWGGAHIRFEVTEAGAAVEYDCAHGTIEGKIRVDARGRFSIYGMHYEERGGPARPGDEAKGYRVRLRGLVGGSLMKLTVTRPGSRKVIGTFTLTRDQEAELTKCR